jgi:hypothetical protein
MKTLKKSIALVAFLCAGMVNASINYTNESEAEQTVTVVQRGHYSYYGIDNWDWTTSWTVTVAPGETVVYDDYYTTYGDGAEYSEVYELGGVE